MSVLLLDDLPAADSVTPASASPQSPTPRPPDSEGLAAPTPAVPGVGASPVLHLRLALSALLPPSKRPVDAFELAKRLELLRVVEVAFQDFRYALLREIQGEMQR